MRARVRAVVGSRFVRRGAPLLVVALTLAAAWPWMGKVAVTGVGLWIACDVGLVALGERRRLRRALLEVGSEGRQLADMLLAWGEAVESGQSGTRMGSWLADVLGGELAALPVGAERAWVRRGLGTARYLVPVAVALWMFWWMRPETAMPWFGIGGGGMARSGGVGPGDEGPGGSAGPAAIAAHPTQPPEAVDAEAEEREPEGPQPPDPQAAPFLDIPAQAQVVVPEFTRDGPTRRAMAQQALVGIGEEGGAPQRRASQSRAGDQDPASAPPNRERFERAAEKALQSRHVPERERAIVKSFFDALRGADK